MAFNLKFAAPLRRRGHQARKHTEPVPSGNIETLSRLKNSSASSAARSAATRGSSGWPRSAASKRFPAPCGRLDRADGDPRGLDTTGRIEAYRKADDRGRIIAGLTQRQPRVRRLPRVAWHRYPRQEPARFQIKPHPEEVLQVYLLGIASGRDFDFGIEAEQRRYTIGRSEIRCRKIAADCSHGADSGVGGPSAALARTSRPGISATAAASSA